VRRQPDDFRGVFAVFVAMFRRPDNAAASGEPAPEVLWLLGPDGLRHVIDNTQRRPAPIASRVFDRGGYAVMRSGWDRDAHQLIFDVGPLGCHVSSGHGHEDLLAIQCSVFGDRVLIDPGTYGYTAEPAWRNYFRSAAAHSTVTIDRLGQSEPAGPFGWRRRPRAVLREWLMTPACDVVDAEHNAYAHLTAPVMHRRRVVFVKPDFWVVIDDLTGTGSHSVELTFQCAPLHAELTLDACRVDTERGSVLWILPFANVPIANEIRSGEVEPIRGWISERYGRKQPAPALVCSAHAQMPMRAITVLYPTRDRNDSPPLVGTLCDDGSLSGVVVSGRSVRLDHDRVVVTHH